MIAVPMEMHGEMTERRPTTSIQEPVNPVSDEQGRRLELIIEQMFQREDTEVPWADFCVSDTQEPDSRIVPRPSICATPVRPGGVLSRRPVKDAPAASNGSAVMHDELCRLEQRRGVCHIAEVYHWPSLREAREDWQERCELRRQWQQERGKHAKDASPARSEPSKFSQQMGHIRSKRNRPNRSCSPMVRAIHHSVGSSPREATALSSADEVSTPVHTLHKAADSVLGGSATTVSTSASSASPYVTSRTDLTIKEGGDASEILSPKTPVRRSAVANCDVARSDCLHNSRRAEDREMFRRLSQKLSELQLHMGNLSTCCDSLQANLASKALDGLGDSNWNPGDVSDAQVTNTHELEAMAMAHRVAIDAATRQLEGLAKTAPRLAVPHGSEPKDGFRAEGLISKVV